MGIVLSSNIGVSKGMFVAGIVLAILLSSVISLSLSMQFAVCPKGEMGAQGLIGEQGIQGPQGIQGEKGDKGNTGATGAVGATGLRGATGTQGATGEEGIQGETGLQGPKGDTGDIGPMGPAGGFGDPDYDSGWISLTLGDFTDFTHNLGQEDNLFVYIYGRNYDLGYWWYIQDSFYISWLTLDENTISVYRLSTDSQYQQARMLIWKIDEVNQLY